MALTHLSLTHLRNISNQKLSPGNGLNFIVGDNGSGKTSILEAIYLLGRARSFRTHQIKQVVSSDADQLVVVGKLDGNGTPLTIGYSYDKSSKSTIRINGQNVRTSAELANHFPLLFIGSDTGRLLGSGERQRRRCLDWGVFHVEHRFLPAWQKYNKALKQRNASLKRCSRELTSVWDQELASSGEEITLVRKQYVDKLKPIFFEYLDQLVSDRVKVTNLSFEQGWSKTASSLLTYLEENYQRDTELGYTQRGPHRSDLKLDIEHGALAKFGSGGQQKLITCALLLSQVALYKKETGQNCTILVDDLPAELDPLFRESFIRLLVSLETQLFITATEAALIDVNDVENKKMFHVEHGTIKALDG